MARVRSAQQSVRDRFEAAIDRSGGPNACHPWTGVVLANGYGQFYLGGTPRQALAHRLALAWSLGEDVPRKNVHVDHECHDPETCTPGPECPHRRCCNPRHLAYKTPRENNARSGSPSAENARKTHCPAGHEYTDETLYTSPKGKSHCRVCAREADRKWRAGGGQRKAQPPRVCPECGVKRAARGFRKGICGACVQRARRAAA